MCATFSNQIMVPHFVKGPERLSDFTGGCVGHEPTPHIQLPPVGDRRSVSGTGAANKQLASLSQMALAAK